MKVEKISFLKRIYLAITDFRLYPYVQKEKLSTAIGYFLKLMLFTSIIIGAFFSVSVLKELPDIIVTADDAMPEFVITNGVLDSTENTEKEINEDWYLVVRDDVKYQNLNTITFEETEEHEYYVLVLSDATIVTLKTEDEFYELGGIFYEESMNVSKSEMIVQLEKIYQASSSKLLVWAITSIGIFMSFFIVRIWTLVMYGISIWIINMLFGLRLRLKEYCKIAIYVSTLPIILETIAIIVVGKISESINFITILISCVYIFYALRALKLDSFLMGGKGNTAEEKLKNALEHAQKELEKQIAELEKEEKEIKEKQEDTKEKEEEKQDGKESQE